MLRCCCVQEEVLAEYLLIVLFLRWAKPPAIHFCEIKWGELKGVCHQRGKLLT